MERIICARVRFETFRLSANYMGPPIERGTHQQMRPEKVVASYPDVVHIEVDLLKLALK